MMYFPTRPFISWRLIPIALFTACILGCGSNTPYPMGEVSGIVTIDGRQLTNAIVFFHPVGSTPGPGATGITDEEGRYELTTNDLPGAPLGEYKVCVSKRTRPEAPKSSDRPTMRMSRLVTPPIYKESRLTPLEFAVQSGENIADFKLSKGGQSVQ